MNEPSYPLHLQRLVEEYLESLDFGADRRAARLVEAMRYSLLAGGKRIRPVLTLAVADSRGVEPATVLPTAAALELIHTYSLIHDDLPSIDDDDLRRGRPTCHVVYGEDVAILAGDGLFSEAFHLVLDQQRADSGALLAVVAEIARATGVGGMVGGQFMDVAGLAADHDDLRVMHALKTGRLIEAAIVAGALLSGAREDREPSAGAAEVAAYRAFATELGVLFQIVDDILDETGDAAVLGKTAGKDRTQAKATYVALFGLDEARRLAEETHGRALDALRALPGDTAVLVQIADYILRRRH
ncbi:MAG: polyprenyl synthetase family protein [Thermoleophilia bacterium]|nr:polyprenyl synthetase family protein [Thermoleophilia bacterium]